MAITVHHIADYFINKVDHSAGDAITHLKLQKMVYYAQAWYLAINHRPLFDAQFEAWRHGPVCRALYNKFSHLGWSPISDDAYAGLPSVDLDKDTIEFLDELWEEYGQYSAKKLEDLTHAEFPWIEARGDCAPEARCEEIISEQTMERFYQARLTEVA